MTDAPVVGSAAFELRAKRDQLKQDLAAAERDLKQSTGQMEADANRAGAGIGKGFGSVAKGLAIGITALVAVLGTAITLAVQFGGASLKMANDIADSAKRIGIGTSALQEWEFVARRTGQNAQEVSGSLENFALKASQAAAGLSKQSKDAFAALGFSQSDLKAFKDTEQLLDAVIDRIGELKDPDDRVAIAEKLGLGPLATALREGSDEVARLRDEARDLGYVMDESLVKKGAEAQGQLDDLSKVIGIQMAEAFINLSDEVLAFTSFIADALKGLNNFIEGYGRTRRVFDAVAGDGVFANLSTGNLGGAVGAGWRNVFGGGQANIQGRLRMAIAKEQPDYENTDDPAYLRSLSPERLAELYGGRSPNLSGRTNLTPVTRTPRGDNSAQRAAEREARRAERVQEEINRAKERALRIEQDDLLTVQQLYDLRQRELGISRAGEDADLKSRLARKDLTKAEFDQLTSQNAINRGLEDRIAKDVLARDLADERLANERALNDLTVDLLTIQSGAARTAGERRKIELQLLQIAQRRAREDLETELSRNPSLSEADKNDRRGRLADLQMGQTRAVNDRNLSPLEQWRDASLKTAAEIDEAYERIAANGLDALNNGIVDAIMGTKTLGEVFSNVAKQILADLLQIGVRRGITEPLANALFGGEQGGGSKSWISDIFKFAGNFKIPGFAKGVENFSGGLAYVHQGELLANLAPGTSVIPANVVNGMGGGGVTRVVVTTNDERFNAYVDGRAIPASEAAFSSARTVVPSDMAQASRYSLSRR